MQVRKPEKGTQPKLFYIEADEASLVPTRTAADDQFLCRAGSAGEGGRTPLPLAAAPEAARRVYDVRPRRPSWGWHVVAYTWTK